MVHQEPRLFPDLSVAENVYIGHAPSGPLRTVDWGATRRAAKALFEELDVRFDVQALVRGLSMADQQLIEIAKALSVDAGVLILDEPTASLSAHEVERLFTIVRGLRDRGVAILFVSHRLGEVFDLCDTATVFRDGRHVITTATSELTTADLIRHMVGRTVTLFPKVETARRRRPARGRGADAGRRVRGHRVLGAGRRDRRDGGARRGGPDRGRPGAVRDRPARRRRGARRGQARPLLEPVGGDVRRRRLPARGPAPGGPRARLLDRRERHAADPAPPVPAVPRPVSRSSGRWPASTRTSSTCG